MARRKSLAQRLGFKGLSFFGVKIFDSDPGLQTRAPIVTGTNLLEVEVVAEDQQTRTSDDGNFGSGQSSTGIKSVTESPELVPLIELLKRQDRIEKIREVGSLENTFMCCMCMGRKNRSALIPCGHTFCGGCSRKLCFDHGTCPTCNYPFSEFVDLI
ncbi:hypothetical protein POM88_033166 [Heracleum sosnowskyi]|uniref:RING-type domain-containing protein n=1 Tax=Heracleum sosnowskyi TaxID=360622 RepID=A0AAD8I1L0_9APIA|nr:hypothetical protein POM88_033166 [Heracleum sosnowskyi]